MIRILLCCGGGFSSSAIATRMEKEIKEKTKNQVDYVYEVIDAMLEGE